MVRPRVVIPASGRADAAQAGQCGSVRAAFCAPRAAFLVVHPCAPIRHSLEAIKILWISTDEDGFGHTLDHMLLLGYWVELHELPDDALC